MMKKMRRKITIYLILVLLIAGGLPAAAYGAPAPGLGGAQGNGGTAETEAGETTGETADGINYLPVTDPENAPQPEETAPVYDPASYTRDIFFPQSTLRGLYSSTSLYFYVPEYWDTKYVYAQIQYDVSQLIESRASSVTFSINNVPIQSYKLEYKDGRSQLLYVKIPMSEVKTGFNSLTLSAYARLFDEEGCVDDYSNANWLSIADTSYVRCGYECRDPEHRISYYPYPFLSTYEPTGAGLTIAVSDQAARGEVAAAMNLMADLSTNTEGENKIQVCLLSDLAATNPTRVILVSDYDNLPQEYKQLVLRAPDASQNATVTFTDSPQGNPLLIVTSADDNSLMEAASMLMDESRRVQESGNTASVEKGSSQLAVNAAMQSGMIAGNYTLKDIMGSGLTFVGPFHQENYVYLPVSKDFVLSDGGKVALKFRYSENLDFTRSLITVSWGDIPIASKRLTREKASGDELNFDIPADVIGTEASSIKISFDLEIADLICTPRQSEMPWAYVSRDSTIFLPTSSDVTLSFDLKASPFRKDGKFNDVMLILSDTPSTAELNLLGQIVAMYGNGVKPYGNFTVKRAGEFSKEDADYNIITAGTYGGNAFLSQLGDKLDFKYNQDGTAFESNEQLILSREYGEKIGIMQLIPSPFALNRGLLAVTGSSSQSLQNVQEYLRDSKGRSQLTKDCVIIDPELNLKAFQFIRNGKTQEEPGLAEKIVKNKRTLIFTAVATSAMLMMLIAVIIILLRVRMYRRKDDR